MSNSEETTRLQIRDLSIILLEIASIAVLTGMLIAVNSGEKSIWSDLDYFEGVSACISLFGFGAVIYQLQKQREDSDEEQKRHAEIIERQQQLFERNSKISLFKKRMEIFENLKEFIEFFEIMGESSLEDRTALIKKINYAQFLFPEHSNIHAYILEVFKKANRVERIFRLQKRTDQEPQVLESELLSIYQWFSTEVLEDEGRKLTNMFEPYLRLDK